MDKKEQKVNSKVVDSSDKGVYGLEESMLDSVDVYDDGEIASNLENNQRIQALRAQAEKLKPQTHPDFDGKTCLECGDDMPKERLEMNRIYCTSCQQDIEAEDARRKKLGLA